MAKLTVFNFLSVNGFYKGPNDDISWNKHGAEEAEFSAESLRMGNILLFGRTTYEMMAGYWTSPAAMENLPEVATAMNTSEKIVFSTTMTTPGWNKTRVISSNIISEIRKLKQISAKDLTILGSGSIVTQFAEAGLIDIFQFMIYPVALSEGTPIFDGIGQKLDLKLIDIKMFNSGTVLQTYKPTN